MAVYIEDIQLVTPSDIPVATSSSAGIVRPDGSTITISNGVISATGGGGSGVGAIVTQDQDGNVVLSSQGAEALMITDWVTIATGTIGHGGNSSVCTATCPVHAGYTPVALGGFYQSDGTRNNWLVPWLWNLTTVNTPNDTVEIRVCNHHATDNASCTYHISVLYARTS